MRVAANTLLSWVHCELVHQSMCSYRTPPAFNKDPFLAYHNTNNTIGPRTVPMKTIKLPSVASLNPHLLLVSTSILILVLRLLHIVQFLGLKILQSTAQIKPHPITHTHCTSHTFHHRHLLLVFLLQLNPSWWSPQHLRSLVSTIRTRVRAPEITQ